MRRLTRNALTAIRQNAGYEKASSISEKFGVGDWYLREVERGAQTASPALITAMAVAYGVPEEVIRTELKKARRQLLRRKLAAT